MMKPYFFSLPQIISAVTGHRTLHLFGILIRRRLRILLTCTTNQVLLPGHHHTHMGLLLGLGIADDFAADIHG
jgi:hypothetical protein